MKCRASTSAVNIILIKFGILKDSLTLRSQDHHSNCLNLWRWLGNEVSSSIAKKNQSEKSAAVLFYQNNSPDYRAAFVQQFLTDNNFDVFVMIKTHLTSHLAMFCFFNINGHSASSYVLKSFCTCIYYFPVHKNDYLRSVCGGHEILAIIL